MKNGCFKEDDAEIWYFNGLYHREDGPACIEGDGTKSWYLHIVTDGWPLKAGLKVNRFVAIGLTVLTPLTLIAPWLYYKASKLKKALEEVGVFEPLEHNFITQTKRRP